MFHAQVISLVPQLWSSLLGPASGLVGKAFAQGVAARLDVIDLRDYGKGVHRKVDDSPFGGGAGMVLQVEPLHRAIQEAKERSNAPVALLSPRGRRFDQSMARQLAQGEGLTVICGRYEGVDERVRNYVDLDLSIGDMVLSAGDPAAWCMIDAVVRLVPGVLGNASSIEEESFSSGRLEYPHYTRPSVYEGESVPEVLLSGNHAAIRAWRRGQEDELTRLLRPDLRGNEK